MYYTISDLFDDEELALILDSLYAEELCADDETLRAKLSSISKIIFFESFFKLIKSKTKQKGIYLTIIIVL